MSRGVFDRAAERGAGILGRVLDRVKEENWPKELNRKNWNAMHRKMTVADEMSMIEKYGEPTMREYRDTQHKRDLEEGNAGY